MMISPRFQIHCQFVKAGCQQGGPTGQIPNAPTKLLLILISINLLDHEADLLGFLT